jgi:hypothetical protein
MKPQHRELTYTLWYHSFFFFLLPTRCPISNRSTYEAVFFCCSCSVFFSPHYSLIHSLTHSSKLKLDRRKREKNETDYQYNTNSSSGRRGRRKRPTGTTSLSVGKRLNKLLPLSDLIYTYTYRCMHMRVRICVQYVYACIYVPQKGEL